MAQVFKVDPDQVSRLCLEILDVVKFVSKGKGWSDAELLKYCILEKTGRDVAVEHTPPLLFGVVLAISEAYQAIAGPSGVLSTVNQCSSDEEILGALRGSAIEADMVGGYASIKISEVVMTTLALYQVDAHLGPAVAFAYALQVAATFRVKSGNLTIEEIIERMVQHAVEAKLDR